MSETSKIVLKNLPHVNRDYPLSVNRESHFYYHLAARIKDYIMLCRLAAFRPDCFEQCRPLLTSEELCLLLSDVIGNWVTDCSEIRIVRGSFANCDYHSWMTLRHSFQKDEKVFNGEQLFIDPQPIFQDIPLVNRMPFSAYQEEADLKPDDLRSATYLRAKENLASTQYDPVTNSVSEKIYTQMIVDMMKDMMEFANV